MPFDKTDTTLVGKSISHPDFMEKAVGSTLFSDDFILPGMLSGCALRSPYANARIRKLDVGRAKRLPVFTPLSLLQISPESTFVETSPDFAMTNPSL